MVRRLRLVTIPLLLLLAVQVMGQWRDGWFAARGEFLDPDGYMRLVRVERLLDTGAWYDSRIERSNAPDGEVLHWTRPFDLLLLAGAAPVALFTDWKTGLFWWGMAVAPVLHVAALLLLLWGTAPLLGERGAIYLGLLFAAQLLLAHQFSIGRPDHHALLLLLFAWLLAQGLRLVRGDGDVRAALGAGVAAGISLWVGPEAWVAVAYLYLVLGLGWLVVAERYALKAVIFSASVSAVVAVALLLERPTTTLMALEYDKVSIVHLAVLSAVTVAALALWLLERLPAVRQGRSVRAVLALFAAAAVLAVVATAFPAFFNGPMVDVDRDVVAFWFARNTEVQPLLRLGNAAGSLPQILVHLGPVLLAVPFLVTTLWRGGGDEDRRGWWLVAAGLAAYVPLALFQIRWTGYAQILLVVPYAALLQALLARLDASARPPLSPARLGLIGARAGLVVVFAVGFLIAGALMRTGQAPAQARGKCPLTPMAEWLDTAPALRGQAERIATFVFDGPEILYRTSHAVIATPYHRNHAGILAVRDLLSATDDAGPRAIVRRRGITLILVCANDAEAAKFRGPEGAPSLLRRLEAASPPPWLSAVALPVALAADFKLFKVVEE